MTDPIVLQLRDRRRAKGLSQREVARRMDVHQSMISEWEAGVVAPRIASLRAWAAALGLALDVRLRGRRRTRRSRVRRICRKRRFDATT